MRIFSSRGGILLRFPLEQLIIAFFGRRAVLLVESGASGKPDLVRQLAEDFLTLLVPEIAPADAETVHARL